MSEVQKWDLEDIYKALSMVDMKMDYEEAKASRDFEKLKDLNNKKK